MNTDEGFLGSCGAAFRKGRPWQFIRSTGQKVPFKICENLCNLRIICDIIVCVKTFVHVLKTAAAVLEGVAQNDVGLLKAI